MIFPFFQFGLFVKLFALILILFYFIFVVVCYRQIMLMNQVLNSKIAPIIKTLALFQTIAVAVLFFLAVFLA